MAIAIDGSPISATGTAFAPTLTIPSVVVGSGSNRYLVVLVAWQADTTEPTCAYGAQSMTKISAATSPTISGCHIAAFGLVAPATGTANVVVTSGQAEFSASGGAIAWTGVDQSVPTHGYTSATGTSAGPSVTVGSVLSGEVTIDVFGSPGTQITSQGAGQTLGWDLTIAGAGGTAASYDPTTTGSVAQTYTIPADDWAILGFALQVASASTTPMLPPLRSLLARSRKAQKRRRAA